MSGYGNFVLQNSLKQYIKSNSLKLKLIEKIILCLDKISAHDLQMKWANDILATNIEEIQRDNNVDSK